MVHSGLQVHLVVCPNPELTPSLLLNRCLDYGDQQVVGVFAGTATVSDEALSRVLAAHFRGYMSVVIVANNACRERLTKKLTRDKLPIPDMLAITHMQV